ncbi:MAG: Hpt domain-containing protein [Gemmatimonadales bacterium]
MRQGRESARPEFFLLEAGEYLERLALLARHPAPDPENLLRFATALRSAALMAGPPGYAVLAGTLEDLARRYADRAVSWSPTLGPALAEAVAACRDLLRRVRQWSLQDIEACRRTADALLLIEPEPEVVAIEALAPDEIVAIEVLAPDETDIVPIESLAPDEDVIPIEELAPAEPSRPLALTPFEQSFSTYFRLLHGGEQPTPIEHLLYRGRRALERAEAVRRELVTKRTARADARAISTLLDELLDLVPLALEHE